MENYEKFVPRKKVIGFCEKHHISSLALFGSILTDHFGPKSDVDFLVIFDPAHIPTLFDLVDMESELSSICGRSVDLRTVKELSPYFREDVISQSKIIYG